MKKLILLFLLSGSLYAQTNAVVALKNYIPTYDHGGVNPLGQRCSIDLYNRTGGIMVELVMPKFSKFLVMPEMEFEAGHEFLAITAPSVPENDGIVTNSLIFQGREVSLERKYCVAEKCWSSGSTCLLDRW